MRRKRDDEIGTTEAEFDARFEAAEPAVIVSRLDERVSLHGLDPDQALRGLLNTAPATDSTFQGNTIGRGDVDTRDAGRDVVFSQ
jgi:hypothetical protein